jgi:putative ATP-dependent endonuclease of OLD family
MKLEYFHIKGFRRVKEAHVYCGDATFLIGENNVGKSTVLKAMEIFFSENAKLHEEDFFRVEDEIKSDEVIFEAKFSNLPAESNNWRGFKGRIISEALNTESNLCIYYRKIYSRNGGFKREMKTFKKNIKNEFEKCKSIQDFITNGINEDILTEIFGSGADKTKTIATKDKDKLDLLSEIWDIDETESVWIINPGGIEGNISVRLPKFLLIPAESRKDDIDGSSSVLQKTMKELFEEVRDESDNYKEAQKYLDLLAKELDPNDESKEFGKMLLDINNIISGIFNQTKIHIEANLSDPGTSIKPSFDIEMSSNVKTKPERQGMGSVRSAAFALLRYREIFLERKKAEGAEIRPLIIGFEEPEMYLHPNAANLMRDKIYELATSSYSKIICTTHSPYMIDLGKRIDQTDYPKQILNLIKLEYDETLQIDCCNIISFNTTQAYKKLQKDDKQFIKFLLKIDDYMARVFFCKKIIIVEGDTEELLIKETVERLPIEKRITFLSNYQVVRARGKASIISLVKYLKALSISPFVIHDKDLEEGAIKFNGPILNALDNEESKRFVVENTIEDILGYPEPNNEKPYKAYEYIKDSWKENWDSVQQNWRFIFESKIAPELFNNFKPKTKTKSNLQAIGAIEKV